MFFRSLVYTCFVLLKTCSADESLFIRFDILSWRFLVMFSGWFELTLIYKGSLPVCCKVDIFPLGGLRLYLKN